MKHPDSDSDGWELIWFGKYALMFGLPLVFTIIAFSEQPWWFLGITSYLFCAVSFLAWRAINDNVKLRWRVGLALLIILSWTYTLLLVFAGEGDTQICYDRVQPTTYRGPMQNLGPDPNCKGIPLQDVQVSD